MYTTDMNEGIHAETVTMLGANGDRINAFLARPLGDGPFPGRWCWHIHMLTMLSANGDQINAFLGSGCTASSSRV